MTSSGWILCMLAVLPAIVLLCSAVLDRDRSLLSPFWSLLFPVVVGTTLKLALFEMGVDSAPLIINFSGLGDADLLVSLLQITAFFLLTSVAYFFAGGFRRSSFGQENSSFRTVQLHSQPMFLITLVVCACSMLALYVFVKEVGGGFGSLAEISAKRRFSDSSGTESAGGAYRAVITLARINAILLISIWYCSRNSRRDPLLLLGIFMSSLVTVASCVVLSSRTQLVILLIPAVGVLKFEKVFTWKHLTVVLVGALILANAVSILRPRNNSQPLSISEVISRSNEVPLQLTGAINGTDVTKITRIRKHFDANSDFFYGRTLVDWPIQIVPRSLWPNKPHVGLSYYLAAEIYGGTANVDMGGVPASLLGEFYINFSWAGVFIGAIVYGMLLEWFFNRFSPNRSSTLTSVTVFLIILPLVTYLLNMGEFGATAVRGIVDVVSGLVLLFAYKSLAVREMIVVGLELGDSE